MKDSRDILNLPSDLYSRNLIIAEGISRYKREKRLERIKILDIGGRRGMLDLFLDPEDELTLLDIREGDEKNLQVGNATDMHFFQDGLFDVVTSGDVFEHIPKPDRARFVSEALRVSKGLLVIAAPFAGEGNEQLERIANSYYEYLTGEQHEWLKEHIDNGLPSVEELESLLIESDASFTVSDSNNTDNWLLLQLLSFYVYHFNINDEKAARFFRSFNEHIRQVENDKGNFYRKVFFITNNGAFDYQFKYEYSESQKMKLLEEGFSILADTYSESREEFGAMLGHAESQRKIIDHLENELRDVISKDAAIIRQKDEIITAMESSFFWKMRSLLVRSVKLFR